MFSVDKLVLSTRVLPSDQMNNLQTSATQDYTQNTQIEKMEKDWGGAGKGGQ